MHEYENQINFHDMFNEKDCFSAGIETKRRKRSCRSLRDSQNFPLSTFTRSMRQHIIQSSFCFVLYQITLIYHCQNQLQATERNKFPEKLLLTRRELDETERRELIEFAISLALLFRNHLSFSCFLIYRIEFAVQLNNNLDVPRDKEQTKYTEVCSES